MSEFRSRIILQQGLSELELADMIADLEDNVVELSSNLEDERARRIKAEEVIDEAAAMKNSKDVQMLAIHYRMEFFKGSD